MRLARGFTILAALASLAAAAADPADRLSDPVQEARARTLFREVRCVVCQSESIDESEADVARDLRQAVRRQIAAGHSDSEVRDFLVQRYGEFILLKPRFSLSNSPLWISPFLIVLVGGAILVLRVRKTPAQDAGLTPDEEVRLREFERR